MQDIWTPPGNMSLITQIRGLSALKYLDHELWERSVDDVSEVLIS